MVQLEFLPWKAARHYFISLNPTLVALIDAWDPADTFGFYRAKYRYGDLLLSAGKLCLPTNEGKLIPVTDSRVPNDIKAALSYSSFPISFPIQKSTEVYMELNQRVIPLVLFNSGVPLGLLETLDPIESCCIRNIWNVSIGARSAFMLPKISDRQTHEKLCKTFNLAVPKPNTAFDHFTVFKELSRSDLFPGEEWSCDVLIMNHEWFKADYQNYHWLSFNNYLHEYMVQYSSYTRNKATVDVLYQLFVRELEIENKRTFGHLFDTVKHVVSLIVGASPSFRPAMNDEPIGPFRAIQSIYLNEYQLDYCPTIMVPHHYHFQKDDRPAYCSISQPSLFETSPRSRKLESYVDDLYQLRLLYDTFVNLVKSGKLRIDGTLIEKAVVHTSVDYYHANADKSYFGIKSVNEMASSDQALINVSEKNHKPFSEINRFTRSCIRLSSLNGF